ncbi:MAG: hypothetical protein HGB37_03515 [Candidatus Moranbacteria bacterium]|jgi:hypothetical protein|nr:hypothetical protein [Candidatus Moranbacteria bacterium]
MFNGELAQLKSSSEIERAVRYDGKSNSLRIGHRTHIADGACGSIYRIRDADLIGADGRSRRIPGAFVIKEYRLVTRDDIREFLTLHETLKKSGADTWRSFRLIDGRNMAIMTDGEADDSETVSRSNVSESSKRLLSEGVDDFFGVELSVRKATESAVRAGRFGVVVPGDSWFANISTGSTPENVGKSRELKRIFIGDYDTLYVKQDEVNAVIQRNLKELLEFLEDLITRFVASKEHGDRLKELVREQVGKADSNDID